MGKPKVTQEDIMKLLDSCYEKCLIGIPMLVRVLKIWQRII